MSEELSQSIEFCLPGPGVALIVGLSISAAFVLTILRLTKHRSTKELLFWRISLTAVGVLIAPFSPLILGRDFDEPLSALISVLILAGAGFVAGSIYGRFRSLTGCGTVDH